MNEFSIPTFFIDCDSGAVIEFARTAIGNSASDREKAVKLFYAVRDEIRYDPYNIDLSPEGFQARTIISKRYGYCVAKAIVLCAAARASGIPSRLAFADVKNHLTTQNLRKWIGTDTFYFHGYTELFIENKWVKATPTFNISLCNRFGVKALDFDGCHDALLHPYDTDGRLHMEYINYHGSFSDVPYKRIIEIFRHHYKIYFEFEKASNSCFDDEAAENN